MLINLYILSLVLGAVLLGAALFLGEKGVDADDQTRAHDDTTRASQFGQLDGVSGGDYFARTVRSRRFGSPPAEPELQLAYGRTFSSSRSITIAERFSPTSRDIC